MDDVPVGIGLRVEEVGIEDGIGDDVGEIVAHGRTVRELEFGGTQFEWIAAENKGDARHEAASGLGLRLKMDEMGMLGGVDGEESESGFEFCLAARKPGFDQGQSVAPGSTATIVDRVLFSAFQTGIEDPHLIGLPDRDGLRRIAKLPSEQVGSGEPDTPSGGDGVGEGLEGTGLDDVSGPGVEVGLGPEPGSDDVVGLGGVGV